MLITDATGYRKLLTIPSLLSAVSCGGARLSPLRTSATIWPIAPGTDECGTVDRGNRRTQRKTDPVSLCLPQMPHDLTREQDGPPWWGNQRLTA
jgi:hypothetical protein